MQQPLTVIFIGPQGSGKGTQIERLYQVLTKRDPLRRVVDIQTGRRFRSLAAKHETFAERKVAHTLDTGVASARFSHACFVGRSYARSA
jgi:adenylate kinase family enzyme